MNKNQEDEKYQQIEEIGDGGLRGFEEREVPRNVMRASASCSERVYRKQFRYAAKAACSCYTWGIGTCAPFLFPSIFFF